MAGVKQVVAALLFREDRVLIAKRAADDPLAGFWEFPGGKIEDGESPQESLAREMLEEFQITVSVGDFFADSKHDYGRGVLQILAYWTQWTAGALTPQVHAEIAWALPEELEHFALLPADVPIAKKLLTQRG